MKLIKYEEARRALSILTRIDEAKDWKDKAAALAAYGRQAKDVDLEMWSTEIKERAKIRMGEISRELEIAPGEGGHNRKASPKTGKSVKYKTLKSAGISKSEAQRCEHLAAKTEAEREQHIARKKEKIASRVNGVSSHRTRFTGEFEWYTPVSWIKLARKTMGGIELDPASSREAQKNIQAERFYTADDDALKQEWKAKTVWLNPPYSQPLIAHFIEKLVTHVTAGDIKQAILLTNASTDTRWFHQAAHACKLIGFTSGRVRFVDPHGNLAVPTQGHAFFYFGSRSDVFFEAFSELLIVKPT